MEIALKVYSVEEGFFSESVKATDIKSHSHARKLAPFADDSRRMVYWVGWGKPKNNNKPRVAHFKRYPSKGRTVVTLANDEIALRTRESRESNRHIKAKELIQSFLTKLLEEKKHLPWAFKDPDISEFPMSGDFLAGAEAIEVEYGVKTPMGEEYRLDVAILGKTILNKPILLAGIEIEFTHKFDFSKSLICKTLGFPLISIDVTEVDESDINEEWAKQALIETTRNSIDGFRRNYIYIHRMLSTVYIDIPRDIVSESRHQYVIFTKEQDKLIDLLKTLKERLSLSDRQVIISPVVDKNKQLNIQVMNAGNLAGEGWKDHNDKKFIQLTLDKPCNKSGALYYFHLVLASLCNSFLDCLVGYKYELGEVHNIGDSLRWMKGRFVGEKLVKYHVGPKRVSEPVRQILRYVES